MVPEHRYVTIDETASLLAVSSATIRNWVRHDYLRPEGRNSGVRFRYDDVRDLRERIRSGALPRLLGRANKAGAKKTFIPDEYLRDRSCIGKLEEAVTRIGRAGVDCERAVFILSLSLAFRCMGWDRRDMRSFLGDEFRPPERNRLGRELECWHAALGRFTFTKEQLSLLDLYLPEQRDALGLIYQSLLREGRKARGGAYYTPSDIVDDMARSMTCTGGGGAILDPCCGTGQFLLAFGKITGDPEGLHGYDVDRIAVRIARINLMLEFKGLDFDPKIYHSDFLFDAGRKSEGGFDIIATNPPWGLHYSRDEREHLKQLFPEISSLESFSCILRRSIESVRDGGRLSFLLPESIMHVKAHGEIRDYLLRTTRIERITHLGRVFKNVFTPVIRIDLQKGGRPGKVLHDSGTRVHAVRQTRFSENADRVFDVNIDNMDAKIMTRVFGHPHVTLKGRAEWALGIVTGDNARFLRNGREEGECEPIWKGRDVDHYFLKEPDCFIRFSPARFQQSAPEWKYRAREKLVYRFISKRLVVAYDDGGRLTLNSANIILPKKGDYPIKAVLALFNSSLYQFLFQKKFSSLKVLRGHLEFLPLPLWTADSIAQLEILAEGVLGHNVNMSEVDEYVMKGYGLSNVEREHLLGGLE